MADKARSVRGTQDIFGEEAARFDHVVETFHRVRKLYGFKSVHTPVFEFTEVFARSIGETTDVVSKEMYSFEDRGGESLTLRPEFTAGIARAYISNGWQQHAPLKLATHGPLFRYERPQKGRYRQFHQLDAEVLGAAEPAADVEVIALAAQLLGELGVSDKVVLQLNTVGDAPTREAWRAALIAHFGKHRDALSEDSRQRLDINPLRILDSKAECDKALVGDAPRIDAYLSSEAGAFFEAVRKGLDAAGVAFERNETLVRGLDYYRHTAFEFVTTHLGSQGTVIGGGRYDGLIEALGGPHTPAVGWAGGIERLAMLTEVAGQMPSVAVVADLGGLEARVVGVSNKLRAGGIGVDQGFATTSKRQSEQARKRGCRAIVWLRADDDARGAYYVQELGPDEPATWELTRQIREALGLQSLVGGNQL